jgi:hypothetical protein
MALQRTLACSIFFMASFAAEQPSQAAGCINGHPSVEQEFQNAEFVVLGRLDAIRKNVPVRLPYKHGTYKSRVMIQTVTVRKQYKGSPKRIIVYRDEYSSAQFPMNIGKEYILFYRKRNDGELFIDNCGNSQKVYEHSKVLLNNIARLARASNYRSNQ